MQIQYNYTNNMPYSNLWKNNLIETSGTTAASHLIGSIQNEYIRLCESHGSISHRGLRKHLHGNIFPQMAVYKTMLKQFSLEIALSSVQKLHLLTLKGLKKRHEWICKFPLSYSFYRIAVPLSLKYGHPSAGWKIEFIENSKVRICARVHSCFYYNIMKKYEVAELISIYCNGDDYVFNGVSLSYVKWGRKTTMPTGGDHCDVIFLKN